MKNNNPFFKKQNFVFLNKILNILGKQKIKKKIKITNVTDLKSAHLTDISFINNMKYLDNLKKSKAKYIITNENLFSKIKNYCYPIVVTDVLKSVYEVVLLFYPDSLDDAVDFNAVPPNIKSYKTVKFGNNVCIGQNVKIGKNTIIGHNSIIESNVQIGSNCIIGNNVLIKNTFIGKNVRVLDGSIIGKKGFGFFPKNNINVRYPHIGMVIINDNVEIGCNNTIDRGSLSNTIIGKNTFIDNQVHIAHNVNIGSNCIITGQVGFAGSSIIGNRVSIGGQAGISGHLKIGNNVQIGGGSGVVKNIPDNSKVMGYPAKDIRKFLKENK